MRYLAVAVVCLAIGFGAGYLAFDWPFGGSDGPDEAEVVGDQLLHDLRRDGASSADSASCGHQQASDDFRCTVLFDITGSTADIRTYIVHPDGSYAGRR